jgi:hypothetical protein
MRGKSIRELSLAIGSIPVLDLRLIGEEFLP